MTAPWDFVRGRMGVDLMLQTAAAHGIEADRCLRGSQIGAATSEVEAGQELQVARNLLKDLGDLPGLGVETGARVSIASLGVWGFAVLTSPTWGDALLLGLRFSRLASAFVTPELVPGPDLRIRVRDEAIPADVRDFLTERDLAATATLIPSITGFAPAAEFETRLTGARAAALADVIPSATHLRPGRAENLIVADAAVLTTPLPQADATTRRACERECERLLEARQARTGTAARVRALLLADPAAMPSMEDVAGELHLDVRTLRRHLARDDASYRALREEVASTLAIELLSTIGLSVGEVAGRLGYGDATAFTHAFTRWTGSPPSSYRFRG